MARARQTGNRRAGPPPTYIAHVVPGLEEFAESDLGSHLGDIEIVQVLERFDERTSLLLFRYAGPPADLIRMRSTEDVFALVAESGSVAPDRKGLVAIKADLVDTPGFGSALTAASQIRSRKARRVTFRVIARVAGQHTYRRVDVQRAVERAVLERFPTWRLVEDAAQFELWVHLVGRVLVIGIRLSDISMRRRAGERVYLPASLKPTVAYAMTMLSQPQDSDVFLDPMCGSGTILIERAETARYQLLIGGDVNADAVAVTGKNIGPRYKPIEIHLWDARELPLKDGSVSVIVTNMPWGKQIGSANENRVLYPELLREWVRVLEPAGRMVLLISEHETLMRSIKEQPTLTLRQQIRVLVRGLPARIYVLSSADTYSGEHNH